MLAGNSGKVLTPLEKPGVDTGMGLERLAMVSQKTANVFETDLFLPIINAMETNKSLYKSDYLNEFTKRMLADHIRASTFLIADGIRPSNKGAGYILRRLLRREIVTGVNDTELAKIIINKYKILELPQKSCFMLK